MKIPGSVAIVTGGARGFGKAFSEALLSRNAKVCFGDVNVTEGRKTERYFQDKYGPDSSMFIKCDVTKENDFRGLFNAAVQKFKKLDIVVNNAGILHESMWEKTIEINLTGVIRGTKLAIEYMNKEGTKGGKGGLVVNMSSNGGLMPVFFMPSYIASKYGVIGYTRSWAQNPSLDRMGLKFACLCPGVTKTDMFFDLNSDDEKRLVTFDENSDAVRAIITETGVSEIDEVTNGFLDLVQKEDNNGAILTVQKTTGMRYRFTKHPHRL